MNAMACWSSFKGLVIPTPRPDRESFELEFFRPRGDAIRRAHNTINRAEGDVVEKLQWETPNMKRPSHDRRLVPAASAIFAVAIAAMSGAAAQQKTVVVLGTATQGGGFQVYGTAYAAALNGADATLHIEERPTKGSTENVPLLGTGKIDIGLATGEVTHEGLNGIGRPKVDVKIINAMYPNSGMFMVCGDSPYRTLSDLKGKPIAWGAAGSGFVVLARYVFDGLGMDSTKDFSPIFLEHAGDGSKMVLEGRAAALWGGGVGWPNFIEISMGPSGSRFITPDAESLNRVVAKYPFIKPVTLPAGSYPGQSAPVAALGSWSLVLARGSLPDEAAYKLARALHKAEGALGAKLDQAKESTLANTLVAAPRQDLIHPGVLRYMREAGILR